MYLASVSQSYPSPSRESRSGIQAGTEAETVGEHCLLTCSSWLVPLVPSSTSCSGVALPISITNQGNAPQTCPQVSPMEAVPPLRLSPPR